MAHKSVHAIWLDIKSGDQVWLLPDDVKFLDAKLNLDRICLYVLGHPLYCSNSPEPKVNLVEYLIRIFSPNEPFETNGLTYLATVLHKDVRPLHIFVGKNNEKENN